VSGEENILKLVEAGEPAAGEYRLDDQIGFILRRAHQRHVALFAAHIADLTPPQFAALAKLRDIGETSQNQLGQLVAMDAATIKGVIDRLKARGMVELGRNDGDKRLIMVRLTDAGRRAVEELVPLAEKITAETLSPLTSREVDTLVRLLGKIA
jgi:DNA-binding MarR family transcriptional regulator